MQTLIRSILQYLIWVWICTVYQCPSTKPSPGFTDNPLYTALWCHSNKNSRAINNRCLDFVQTLFVCLFCVEVLRPSQPNGVMPSAVSLPNHTLTGQAWSSKRLTSIVHILSPETDNCPSWISGRERMTVENISWSISTKECCRPRRGLNPRPPGLQSDGASNWATEAGKSYLYSLILLVSDSHMDNSNIIQILL